MPTKMEVLLIADDETSLRLIEAMLRQGGYTQDRLHCSKSWEDGMSYIEHAQQRTIALVSDAFKKKEPEFTEQIRSHAMDLPIVLLHEGTVTMEIEAQGFSLGVQEVLPINEISVLTLLKALRSSVERHRLRRQIHELSMMDELTGINNRQGFMLHAEQGMALSERLGTEANLFFLDANHMKWVNDNFGHQEGDILLMEISRILQEEFRRTDVIGRVGGDEFAVLALRESASDVKSIMTRLEECIERVNANRKSQYPISFSIGVASSTVEKLLPFDELMEIADQEMYKNKKTTRGKGPE